MATNQLIFYRLNAKRRVVKVSTLEDLASITTPEARNIQQDTFPFLGATLLISTAFIGGLFLPKAKMGHREKFFETMLFYADSDNKTRPGPHVKHHHTYGEAKAYHRKLVRSMQRIERFFPRFAAAYSFFQEHAPGILQIERLPNGEIWVKTQDGVCSASQLLATLKPVAPKFLRVAERAFQDMVSWIDDRHQQLTSLQQAPAWQLFTPFQDTKGLCDTLGIPESLLAQTRAALEAKELSTVTTALNLKAHRRRLWPSFLARMG